MCLSAVASPASYPHPAPEAKTARIGTFCISLSPFIKEICTTASAGQRIISFYKRDKDQLWPALAIQPSKIRQAINANTGCPL